MNEAVRKMKEIDESLNFLKSELGDRIPKLISNEFSTFNYQKIEKNGKKVELMTQWSKENKNTPFKLRSLSLLEQTETGKHSIYSVERESDSTK